ncbi:hypothetical protein LTR65_008252 [Meristemomyces frigidus]
MDYKIATQLKQEGKDLDTREEALVKREIAVQKKEKAQETGAIEQIYLTLPKDVQAAMETLAQFKRAADPLPAVYKVCAAPKSHVKTPIAQNVKQSQQGKPKLFVDTARANQRATAQLFTMPPGRADAKVGFSAHTKAMPALCEPPKTAQHPWYRGWTPTPYALSLQAKTPNYSEQDQAFRAAYPQAHIYGTYPQDSNRGSRPEMKFAPTGPPGYSDGPADEEDEYGAEWGVAMTAEEKKKRDEDEAEGMGSGFQYAALDTEELMQRVRQRQEAERLFEGTSPDGEESRSFYEAKAPVDFGFDPLKVLFQAAVAKEAKEKAEADVEAKAAPAESLIDPGFYNGKVTHYATYPVGRHSQPPTTQELDDVAGTSDANKVRNASESRNAYLTHLLTDPDPYYSGRAYVPRKSFQPIQFDEMPGITTPSPIAYAANTASPEACRAPRCDETSIFGPPGNGVTTYKPSNPPTVTAPSTSRNPGSVPVQLDDTPGLGDKNKPRTACNPFFSDAILHPKGAEELAHRPGGQTFGEYLAEYGLGEQALLPEEEEEEEEEKEKGCGVEDGGIGEEYFAFY